MRLLRPDSIPFLRKTHRIQNIFVNLQPKAPFFYTIIYIPGGVGKVSG
jgi:hypothetical protein